MSFIRTIQPIRVAVTGLAASAALFSISACSDNESSMPGMDHGTMAPSTSSSPSAAMGTPAQGPRNSADVTFAQMMIPHHQQAVEMSDIILTKTDISADVTKLGQQIKDAQAPEITQMSGWLTGWDESTSMPMGHDMRSDDGMMSEAEMGALENASGDNAAKLYLEGMTKHHRGAITMAKTELADGQNADAKKLAQQIVDTQQAEITTMQQVLNDL